MFRAFDRISHDIFARPSLRIDRRAARLRAGPPSQHLSAACRYSELRQLASKAWLDAQSYLWLWQKRVSVRRLDRDGGDLVDADDDAVALAEAWRGAYISTCLRSTTGWYPPRVVSLLVHAGHAAQAMAFAELVPDAFERCLSYCEIADAAIFEHSLPAAAQALDRALAAAVAELPPVSRAEGLANVARRALELGEDRVARLAISELSRGEMGHWMGRVVSDLAPVIARAARPDLTAHSAEDRRGILARGFQPE
jgi:hypothetical protein